MGEREDIMGLAFLVGGEIHNLKKSTGGEGENNKIGKTLPNPADFVKAVANKKLDSIVKDGKARSAHIGEGVPPPADAPSAPAGVGGLSVTPETLTRLFTVLDGIHNELKILTANMPR